MSTSDRRHGSAPPSTGGLRCDPFLPLLEDYLDDVLEPSTLEELERHLEGCEDCREEARVRRQLLVAVADLPEEIEPPQDLWQGIAGRLEPRPQSRPQPHRDRRFPSSTEGRRSSGPTFRWWSQAVAAGLFTLLGYSAGQWLPSLGTGPEEAPVQSLADLSVEDAGVLPVDDHSFDFIVAEAEFLKAKESLLMSAFLRRDELSPQTLELLHRNLEIIDRATRELRRALEEDPANPRLEGRVLDNYRRELSLLKRLTSLDA